MTSHSVNLNARARRLRRFIGLTDIILVILLILVLKSTIDTHGLAVRDRERAQQLSVLVANYQKHNEAAAREQVAECYQQVLAGVAARELQAELTRGARLGVTKDLTQAFRDYFAREIANSPTRGDCEELADKLGVRL